MARKVTMQQIADYLGMSKYVVSKALSGKQGVSAATRNKVFDAASKLGYFTQKNSKVGTISLKPQSSVDQNKRSILVLMPNVRFQTRESSYWGRLLNGITDAIESMKIGMVIVTESNISDITTVINPSSIMGVISIGLVTTSLLLEVNKMNVPIVMVDHEDPLLPCDTIFNNNFDCSARLANHLIGLGHTNIQFVGDITYSRSFYDRWLGLRSTLELNKQLAVFDEELCKISSLDQFTHWLKGKNLSAMPTALMCANDGTAARVISTLLEEGYRVPQDISVTGFDNKEIAYQMTPTITTVNVAKEELGKRAVKMLLTRINEKEAPYEKLLMTGSIMLRESTAICRKL